MIEFASRDALFYFNKKHLEDTTIPCWVIVAKGKSYYLNHVICNIPWSTRETPDKSTKGAIKFKNVLVKIDDDNAAEILTLTAADASRLRARDKGYVRILISSSFLDELIQFMKDTEIKFTTLKGIPGSCGRTHYICDIKNKNSITTMQLALPNHFRILQENEIYYRAYDDPKILNQIEDDNYDDDE